MGRRKKQPPNQHRENIAAAAAQLFQSKGINATTMDEIAQAAGYSKATIYVYFTSKQEIISLLALKSMQKLYNSLAQALASSAPMAEKYQLLCQCLLQYQTEEPFYFQILLSKINGAPDDANYLPEERATYQIGEEINNLLRDCLLTGIANGELRPDLQILPTIFSFWGMLAGFIQLAASKEEYIAAAMGQSKEQFLAYGFWLLYRSIARCPEQTNPQQEV